MLRKILCLLSLVFLLSSCGSFNSMLYADANMRKVAIGMTEKEVISVMGNKYELISGNKQETVWAYQTVNEARYMLYFVNGRLAEWEKEWLVVVPEPGKHHHHHR